MIYLKKLSGSSPDFGSKLTSLFYNALCVALLQSTVTPSFQLQIAIRLKHWIYKFLIFKAICVLPQETY